MDLPNSLNTLTVEHRARLALLDACRCAVLLVDERKCITYANQGVASVFQYRPSEVVGRPLQTLLELPQSIGWGPGETAAELLAVTGVVVHGRTKSHERVSMAVDFVPIADGSQRWLGVVIHSDGACAGISSVASEAREVEPLGRLARAIVGKLEALRAGVEERARLALENEGGRPQARQDWEAVSAAAALGGVLLSKLREFSDVGVSELRVADINVMAATAEQAVGAFVGDRVRLRWSVASQPGTVRTAPGLWQRMLISLCVGAHEAMPNGGTLTVVTRVVHVEHAQVRQLSPGATAGAYAVLQVTDTGNTATDGFRRRVVEDFLARQALGVGTAVSAKQSSAPARSAGFSTQRPSDVGTSVEVYLPLEYSAGESKADKRLVVLIVEKDPLIRRVVAKEITVAGYRAIEAAGWTDALEAVRIEQGRIDILLIDLGTPGALGMDLSIRLESLCPRASVVLTSLLGSERLRERGVDVGARPLLQKPFGRAELLATLTLAPKQRG